MRNAKHKTTTETGRRITWNGKTVSLLDVQRVRTLSPKSAELLLVGSEITFRVLLPSGYVESEPVELAPLSKQPSISEIERRFSPRSSIYRPVAERKGPGGLLTARGGCWPVLNADLYASLTPGTWLYECQIGDHREPGQFEVAVCKIIYANGEKQDCYVCAQPTENDERELALSRGKTPEAEAALLQRIKRAAAKPLSKKAIAAREKGGHNKSLFDAGKERKIIALFDDMSTYAKKGWRYIETANLANGKGVTRKDRKPVTARNVQAIIERANKNKSKN
jgi:hypothetical protein